MDSVKIKKILENHLHWIKKDIVDWEDMRADLYDADLRGVNLCGVNLRGANLRGACLYEADLRGADLREANLHGANLCDAGLYKACLYKANLYEANLRGAKNVPFIPMTCPDFGSFIGWKKVGAHIIKLEIPEDAKRSSATTRKCRCDKARVLTIQNLDGSDSGLESVANTNYAGVIYQVGEMVYPDSFDEDRWNECSNGIHFFINRQEVVKY